MKTRYLFPHRFKLIGWVLFAVSLVVGLLAYYEVLDAPWLRFETLAVTDGVHGLISRHTPEHPLRDVCGVLLIIGALLAACSREKHEDEFIAKIRLESLLWATYIHYGLLALAILLVYEMAFLTVMVYGMFTLLFIFLARFHFVLYTSGRAASDEK